MLNKRRVNHYTHCASLIHAITSVGQSERSEKNLSEISKNSVRFFLGAVFCHTKYSKFKAYLFERHDFCRSL